MRYSPQQVDHLAGEYVIGTLRGGARRRFEFLMHDRADVRLAVWEWEQLLHGLTSGIKPKQPPHSVWRGIQRRVGSADRESRRAGSWWLRLAIVAPLIALAAFWLATMLPASIDPDRMAIFASDDAQALWVVSADTQDGVLVVETSGVAAAEDALVYELWALPDDGVPRSLGLLNTQSSRHKTELSLELLAVLDNSANLAISLEPTGGSPTGLPTGPVVYQAQLHRL